MKTKVIDKVILIYFKDTVEGVVKDPSSAIRFMNQWIKDRNLGVDATDSFSFVERDVLKLRLR